MDNMDAVCVSIFKSIGDLEILEIKSFDDMSRLNTILAVTKFELIISEGLSSILSPYGDSRCEKCAVHKNYPQANCSKGNGYFYICDADRYRPGEKSYVHYYSKIALSLFVAKVLSKSKIIKTHNKVLI